MVEVIYNGRERTWASHGQELEKVLIKLTIQTDIQYDK
jgi:hypothetical protein